MRNALVSLALMSVLTATAPTASAATAAYNFSGCLAGTCGSPNGGNSAGTLTLSNIAGVSFSFTSSSNVLAVGSFIRGLFFNGDVGNTWPGTWGSAQVLESYDYSTFADSSVTSANGYNSDLFSPAGKNKDRFLNGESASGTIAGAGVDLTDVTSDSKMALHLGGVGFNGHGSAWIGGVAAVPEFATYPMFLAGFGFIAAVVRRRRFPE
jgi:hypothetical protein